MFCVGKKEQNYFLLESQSQPNARCGLDVSRLAGRSLVGSSGISSGKETAGSRPPPSGWVLTHGSAESGAGPLGHRLDAPSLARSVRDGAVVPDLVGDARLEFPRSRVIAGADQFLFGPCSIAALLARSSLL